MKIFLLLPQRPRLRAMALSMPSNSRCLRLLEDQFSSLSVLLVATLSGMPSNREGADIPRSSLMDDLVHFDKKLVLLFGRLSQ